MIGKLIPEQAAAIIERYFGSWQAMGAKPDVLLPSVPLNAPSTVRAPHVSRQQTRVILSETPGLTRTTPDYYACNLVTMCWAAAFTPPVYTSNCDNSRA